MKNKRIDDELICKPWPEPKTLSSRSVLVLTGPTASGKSSLAMALAEKIEAEIVCCDSMQIYKHLDIGTAKPSLTDQGKIPHHLLDICEPAENFSLARYVAAAKTCFNDILKRGKTPILVGGTTLYVSALVERMQFPEEEADGELRLHLLEELARHGSTAMYQRLKTLDSTYAETVHPNNTKRVLRALERLMGSKMTDAERLEKHKAMFFSHSIRADKDFDYRVFCHSLPRDNLYRRINTRIETMIAEGLLAEARWLLEQNLDSSHTCMKAIGYKELFPYIREEQSLPDAVERLQINTRQYAKRQLTWYRAKAWPMWLFAPNIEEAANRVLKQIARRG